MRNRKPTLRLAYGVLALFFAATALQAGCSTLTGFAAFKRCYLEADSAMDQNNLRRLYEEMLVEDLERARVGQSRDSLDALGLTAPLAQRSDPNLPRNLHNQAPLSHRGTAAELMNRNTQNQLRSFDAGRARNQYRLDQGRIRSQDLFFGTSKR